MSGRVGDLSFKQEELLNEFKDHLSDILVPKHDDHYLLQFLRARRFDLKKSEDMFRKHVIWRKYFSEEYFINEYKCPELLKKYYVAPFLGFDKDGNPVRLIRVGHMDLKGVTQSSRIRDLEEFAVWCLETDRRNTKLYNDKFGRHVETRTFIFDLEGLSLRQITKSVLELTIAYLKLYEANYPENLKVAVVMNIPYFFAWIFNIVKSIISEDTIPKIKIFGKEGYKEELLKFIDPEILPACYGGSLTDDNGDPTCPSLFGTAGPVPTSYYFKNQRRLSKEDDGVREVTIGRRAKKEFTIYADSSDCTIFWEIEVIDQDVNYGIFHKADAGDEPCLEEIVPLTKVGGDHGPATGSYFTKNPGKYILLLDNGFSLIRSKRVLYRLKVMSSNFDVIPIPY